MPLTGEGQSSKIPGGGRISIEAASFLCRRTCRGEPSTGVISKRRKSTRQRGTRHCSAATAFRCPFGDALGRAAAPDFGVSALHYD